MVEHSLDINLANCRVRYKFTDTPILDGISIHETINSVIILIATVSSVHKLSFPHPERIHKNVSSFQKIVIEYCIILDIALTNCYFIGTLIKYI